MSPPTPLLKLSVFWKAKCLLGSHMSIFWKTEICRCETKFRGKRKLLYHNDGCVLPYQLTVATGSQKLHGLKSCLRYPLKLWSPEIRSINLPISVDQPLHFFFYKNPVYKNIKASNGPKIKNILRTYEGFNSCEKIFA